MMARCIDERLWTALGAYSAFFVVLGITLFM